LRYVGAGNRRRRRNAEPREKRQTRLQLGGALFEPRFIERHHRI
jgi:hypothetical protein